MLRHKVTTEIDLDDEVIKQLNGVCDEYNMTQSEVVEEIIKDTISKRLTLDEFIANLECLHTSELLEWLQSSYYIITDLSGAPIARIEPMGEKHAEYEDDTDEDEATEDNIEGPDKE
jgi:antitoxin component of RelBE/YafQ-DinJ toxin-antitoxin module